MHGTIRKWGNSAAIRLPAHVMETANLSVDQSVELRVEDGRVIIEPSAPPAVYDHDSLLAAITDENLHDEIDFGPAVGSEKL